VHALLSLQWTGREIPMKPRTPKEWEPPPSITWLLLEPPVALVSYCAAVAKMAHKGLDQGMSKFQTRRFCFLCSPSPGDVCSFGGFGVVAVATGSMSLESGVWPWRPFAEWNWIPGSTYHQWHLIWTLLPRFSIASFICRVSPSQLQSCGSSGIYTMWIWLFIVTVSSVNLHMLLLQPFLNNL
jgi:hypothetical protein